ncbi:MAG: beta-lactamase family protein [Paludibacteraceae bacterium]|nr:beta-lactamase family protein [Paludibacteraceae bacterium]
MKNYFLVALIALTMVACNSSTSIEQSAAQFEQQIEPYRQALKNVGLNVVVVKDNQIVYTHSFGYKNLETGELLTDSCLFRIASISKSFTTTSLLQLCEEGKVSLATDVSELVGFAVRNPKFPNTPITLEMLLSHTSSICDDEGYFTLDVINPQVNENYAQCYRDYAPGSGYEYCNLNLNMAGTSLERLCGERFDQAIKHRVLDPLGLYGGYCVDSLDNKRFASLYENAQYAEDTIDMSELYMGVYVCEDEFAYAPRSECIQAYQFGYDTPVFSPTGGMKLSAPDLARYMMMHMNYGTSPDGVRILSEQSSKNMQTPRSSDENYGLSLWKTDLYSQGVVLTGHTGEAYGMRSAMFFNPEEKYGFVVISNGALDNYEELLTQAGLADSPIGTGDILTVTLRLLYNNFIVQ